MTGALVAVLLPLSAVEAATVPAAVTATQFTPGNIISDALFYDGAAMTAAQVQSFLNEKGSGCVAGNAPCLKNYVVTTPSMAADSYCKAYAGATNESAASIVAKVGQACGVSQKVLLVLLQKETSLVTKSAPTTGNYDRATGYGCPDTGPGGTANCNTNYYGFFNQLRLAARQYKVYRANATRYAYQAGRVNQVQYNPNTACGTASVFIENQATAGLYIYTPYVPNAAALAAYPGTGDSCSSYGNRNFFMTYGAWFGDPRGLVTGALVRAAGTAPVYLIDGTGKRYVPDVGMLEELTTALGNVTEVPDSVLGGYATLPAVQRLVHNPATDELLWLSQGRLNWFGSMPVVYAWAGTSATWIDVDPAVLARFPRGPGIPSVTSGVVSVGRVDGGWGSWALPGETIGTTGQSKPLQAISVNYVGSPGSSLTCTAAVSGSGWAGAVKQSATCGTTTIQHLEAVQLRLAGPDASTKSVVYRAYVTGRGWTGWAANGATAGAPGLTVEAVQVQVATKPQITGAAQVGASVTVTPGAVPAGTTVGYQWLAGGAAISGATSPTYVVAPTVVGKALTVEVTMTPPGGQPFLVTSDATGAVAPGVLSAPTPTIGGTARVGSSLSVTTGSWTTGAQLSYQWSAGSTPIPGATATTYTPTAADLGKTITFAVSGTLAGYTSVQRVSAPTPAVAQGVLTAPLPVTSGPAMVGLVQLATPGTWTVGTALTYQWLSAGVPIAGATGASYSPVAADVGKALSVRVTGTQAGYATVSQVSAATTTVVPASATPPPGSLKGFTPGQSTRLAGPTRYETAIEVSQRFSPGVPVVYVATGADFPDGLAAAAAAAVRGGPLLLSMPTSLPGAVRAEIERLAPKQIVVVGGPSVLSDDVAAALGMIAPTIRVSGADRYATALAVSAAFTRASEAFVATGEDFPDALAASAAAGAADAPVFLVESSAQVAPGALVSRLRELGVTTVRLAGSPAVVSRGVEDSLRSQGMTVHRYGGADRYATAAAIATLFPQGTSTAFFATGADYPDALAAAALAGRLRSPVLTSVQQCIPASGSDVLAALSINTRVVLGSEPVLSDAVLRGQRCAG
ncbi:cell wall-binding repeat-containing protein [Xylanimonas protaetiae]|uniref:Cell wall-binding repeat-containing protein n=1 Tax=Xylanimonas protaetiae TaxID=2509457 RepID=A0A4P6F6S6_9MICO|nr:cell wall-binding repeat-containing protein [Xylanimonas protaetiae]QAY68927.1 hypothetical protein ET471_01770 [Xylanimonas protaetiae]